jgi:hypothetical protein
MHPKGKSTMTLKLVCPTILALIMLFSCHDGGPIGMPEIPEEEQDSTLNIDSTFQHCDAAFIASPIGTRCCVSGPSVAKPGDTLTYHYQINHSDDQVSWEVREGDISILSGEDSLALTVKFGSTFTTGYIQAYGSGVKDSIRLICNDRVIIRRE